MREFLKTSAGKIATICLLVIAIGLATYVVWGNLQPSEAARIAADRTFICSETGKAFEHTLQAGETIPVLSPYSGKQTGYPAELCYWTKDGKTMDDPTPVLLNSWIGKSGPTFCPVCGRLVVGHNPKPGPNSKPPPTEAEYKARHGG